MRWPNQSIHPLRPILYIKLSLVTESVTEAMYDTVLLCLTKADVSGVNFLEVVPRLLDNVVESRCNDVVSITGDLNGLKVTATGQRVRIRGGSLCKFQFGNNCQTMGRRDTQQAIEKLSDSLTLPMDKANVTRVDVAQNFIMRNPVEVYLNHLGVLRYADRLEEPSGLYYRLKGGRLCFYDKNRERRDKKEAIIGLFRGQNVLRYERRYTQRIAAKFRVAEVTGAMLYDEAFYIRVLNAWRDDYQAIQKINDNDTAVNFQEMKTKRQLYKVAVQSLIEREGGLIQMLGRIKEAQQRGELTKKQALDLRGAVNEACQETGGQTAQSEAIEELDRKVAEAVRFYR